MFCIRLPRFSRWVLLAACAWLGAVERSGADEAGNAAAVRLLQQKCFSCHGVEKQEGGLRVDSPDALLAGGSQGPAIVPGREADSLLLTVIRSTDPDRQMPPRNPLTRAEQDLLAGWIRDGAHWPETARPDVAESGSAFVDPRNPIRILFGGERLDLWSLQPLQPIVPPELAVDANADPSAVIDAFVFRELNRHNLKPAPAADRRTLLRRASLTLTGLLPEPQRVEQLVSDDAPDALRNQIDEWLRSTQYGERQARLWLDVVRYADTHGYERDEFRPLAWKYRDYVVRAFVTDKPFDRFAMEQLAGDELLAGPPQSPADVDALLATGYLRMGPWDSTAAIFQEEDRLRSEQLADLTNTTASAFLGLTLSCCQCHDHKYDPLSQADHFRMRAFFAGLEARDDTVVTPAAELAEMEQHNQQLDAALKPLHDELAALSPDGAAAARHAELTASIGELEATRRQPERAMTAADMSGEIPVLRVLFQGDHLSPREPVEPGFPSVLRPGPAVIEAPSGTTSGRRLALARWIVAPDNPWTARVIVNRVWQQHFGRGLVSTPGDFGYSGSRPSHPELLDWLAWRFMEDGWSLRRLHGWILNSATWQRSSRLGAEDEAALAVVDPDNVWLARQNVRRLDAETIRDTMLQVSGLLRPDVGGPPRWPEMPEELLHAQPGILEAIKGEDDGRRQGWYTGPADEQTVRSLYVIRKRCLSVPFLQAFDLPDASVTCARRDSTVVAPQALMMLNSAEALRCSAALAQRIDRESSAAPPGEFTDQVRTGFRLVLQREPSGEELQDSLRFLETQQRHLLQTATESEASPRQRALTEFCRALLNLNEFLYPD